MKKGKKKEKERKNSIKTQVTIGILSKAKHWWQLRPGPWTVPPEHRESWLIQEAFNEEERYAFQCRQLNHQSRPLPPPQKKEKVMIISHNVHEVLLMKAPFIPWFLLCVLHHRLLHTQLRSNINHLLQSGCNWKPPFLYQIVTLQFQGNLKDLVFRIKL